MAETSYNYEDTSVTVNSVDRLELEISQSNIVIALKTINLNGTSLDVVFKDTLSAGDETVLDDIVAAHTGEPLSPQPASQEVVVTQMPDVILSGPVDSDGANLSRLKINRSGWHFEPRNISWRTATAGSLYSANPTGFTPATCAQFTDMVIAFYDASGNQLTQGVEELGADYQARLTANCTATIMDWWPTFDLQILGAETKFVDPEDVDAYGWGIIAPDIPKQYGGSVSFMEGGCNIGMMKSRELTEFDGKTVKDLPYDPVYKSNKIRIFITHSTGLALRCLVRFWVFRG